MEHAFSNPEEIVISFEQQQLASSGALVAKMHEIESHPPKDDWVISIEKKLWAASDEGAAASSEKASIYRVPDYLKDPPPKDPSRHKAYTPQVVSLGPYHHGMARLQKMERHKWRVLQHVLKRKNLGINVFIESMKKLEHKARACYEEPLDQLNSNQFVEMMLLDGCFILETLRIGAVSKQFTKKDEFKKLNYATDDPIFSNDGTMCSILRDMLMLENQVPHIVLQELRELQVDFMHRVSGPTRTPRLHFLNYMREISLGGLPERVGEDKKLQKRKYCGTELFGIKMEISKGGPEPERVGEDKKLQNLNCCATELTNAGIKLRKGNTDKSSLNIEFKNGILYIPPIVIDDAFKSKFFNFIAFEQCHLDSNQRKITSYVSFLDGLIDSPEDVRFLRNHGIIDQMVGSDAEVADIINCLGHEVFFDKQGSYLSHLSGEINRYYKQKWHFWRAILKERYFNTPWAIISFVAAMLLLTMTAAQTFYALYSYYRPNK